MEQMDTSKLSGEPIIVHHVPLVHCQIPGRQCCGPVKHPNPFCPPDNLGLTRTTSLPERDVLHREALVYSSLIQTSSSGSSTGSDGHSTGRTESLASNSCEESALSPVLCKSRYRGGPLRHNPFLLSPDEDEEKDEGCGDKGGIPKGYLGDYSFYLHGNSKGTANKVTGVSSFHLHDVEYSRESIQSAAHVEDGELPKRHGSTSSPLSMDCGEQDWAEDEDETDEDHHMINGHSSQACSCCSSPNVDLPHSHHCRCCSLSEPPLESKQEYGNDDSYKGWDGPVVNFTAIYHEMSNVIPAKPLNLNVATTPSLTSTTSDSGGTFYLDLHTSPEPRHDVNSCSSDAGKNALYCYNAQQAVDANCNTYPISISSSQTADLSSCVQSQARLGLATQKYYKLVPCDLSSQSSPSPAGSSATSCSEERGSPNQPTEYFLFRQPTGEMEAEVEEEDKEEDVLTQREEEEGEDRIREEGGFETPVTMLEGQVYVNLSPPLGSCSQSGGQAAGHPRSRSYDRSLDASQSLERMLSCPLRLSEASPRCSPRVTSFAEIARSKKRGAVSCREISSSRSQSSLEVAPVLELKHSAEPHCDSQSNQSSQSSCALQSQHHLHPLLGGLPGADYCETDAKAEVGLSSSASPDSLSSVVRYSKEKRPNSLPIQPFMFQPQLGKAQNQVLRPLLSEYISQMQSRARGKLAEDPPKRQSTAPGSVRPSPLGSYSPAHQREVSSFEACSTCCLSSEDGQGSSKAPHSLSCPGTIKPLPLLATPWSFSLPTEAQEHGLVQGRPPASTTPFSLKKDLSAPSLPVASVRCIQRSSTPTSRDPWEHSYGSCEQMKASVADCSGTRLSKMHHLSPQALKWREYRRQNPLGVEKDSHLPPGCLSAEKGEGFLAWRNVFHFPASFSHAQSQLHGQPLKQVQHQHGESLPNYISLTERPPEEFSLSPDVTSEPTSVDVLQKKSLVKAMNMAVDLIVAHFGTSRDPGVKAKLGNSSVSPNVGHLILKYLCPAIRDVLQDGLRAYVLDLIIGQRRNLPWSVVEASAQLGPSTRVIHGLFSKVSHYSELTSHSLRLNAFIFGLLNLRLLEFWFSHLFTHEDIVAMHYHPWGFLPLSQGVCQPLFQELLLLLQPLSLLPFDLDLLFEPQLLQRSQEHIRHKEQLCSAGLGLEQSACSTFQLMRGWDKAGVHTKREAAEARVGEVVVEGEAMESSWEGPLLNIGGMYPSKYGMDQQRGNISESEKGKVEPGAKKPVRGWTQTEATFLNKHSGDLVASRGKAWQEVKGLEVQEKSEVGEKGEKDKKMNVDRQRDRQAGWWYQLMQSSQVYIENSTEGSRFVKWEKRKKPAGGGEAEMGCGQNQYPPREGVVEGAEADKVDELQKELWSGNSCRMNDSSGKGKERLSWMGSPPESRLNEPRKTEDREPQRLAATVETREGGTSSTMWWGRLFGSGMSNPVRADKEDQGPVKSQKNRMPSGWLSLDKSMLDIVAQAVGVGKRVDPRLPSSNLAVTTEQQTEIQPTEPSSWEVRALCHHLATEPGHLSFNKGDRLKVLNHIDPDWLHCALGDDVGLVPMIYVTLTEGSPGSQ